MEKAYYQLQPKELPAKFVLPQRFDQLINRSIPKHIFTTELEYITKTERHRKNPVESVIRTDDFLFGTLALDSSMNELNIGGNVASSSSTNGPPSPTVETRVQRIETMMKSTNQEREVCLFYLESTNWDVTEAVNLFKNTS